MSEFIAYAVVVLVVAGLVALQIKYWVPFDFKKLKGNHPSVPITILGDSNSAAKERGDVVSNTPLAKGFAVVFALAALALLVILTSIEPGSFKVV